MKSIATILSLLFFLSILACNKQAVGSFPRHQPISPLREGDYLATSYIEELKRTKSPLTACPRVSDSRLNLITVEKDGNLWLLMPIYNFHEGGEAFVLNPNGSVNDIKYVSNVALSVKDESSFRFGFDDAGQSFKPTDYVFVQHVEAYVAKVVLVGTYRDRRRGGSFRFQEDGWAIFPDRKFKFEIGTDHVLTDFDYFMEMGPNRIASSLTAFKWEAGSLNLFRTKQQDEQGLDEIIDRHPYLSLQPQ